MSILEDWKKGRGLPNTLVIDGHIHIGAWLHAATFRDADQAVSESVRILDANGVDAFCAVSGGYMFEGMDARLGNDFLLEVWRRMPDRLIPFMSLNPNDTGPALVAELDRMYSAGVRCIKLINAYQENYPGDGPNLMRVYSYAAEHSMLVFNHAWNRDVIERIAGEFPTADFIFAHCGSWVDDILKRYKNVHTNIWNLGGYGWLDRGIKNVGPEKFMYGSDGFLNELSVGIGPVVFADISDEDKKLILGLNVARLLRKVGALPEELERKIDS